MEPKPSVAVRLIYFLLLMLCASLIASLWADLGLMAAVKAGGAVLCALFAYFIDLKRKRLV